MSTLTSTSSIVLYPLHLSVAAEDAILDAVGFELLFSMPNHQTFEMYPHLLANFAVHQNHENVIGSEVEILMCLHAIC